MSGFIDWEEKELPELIQEDLKMMRVVESLLQDLNEVGGCEAPSDSPVKFECHKEGSPININQDEAIAKAVSDGFEVVPSDDRTLLLDLDDKSAEAEYERMLPIVQQHLPLVETGRWNSKSGGLHVKLNIGEALPAADRLLLQACLGSDGTREFLSLLRVHQGYQNPSLLFKPNPMGGNQDGI